MAIELKIPAVGESITEAMIGEWLKSEGDWVEQDEPLVVIETDKVNVDLPAPESGTLQKILKKDGDDVEIGEVIGYLEPGEKPEAAEGEAPDHPIDVEKADETRVEPDATEPDAKKPAAKKTAAKTGKAAKAAKAAAKKAEPQKAPSKKASEVEARVMPAAQRLLAKAGLEAADVEATGPGGRLLKEDVLRHLEKGEEAEDGKAAPRPAAPKPAAPKPAAPEKVVERDPERVDPPRPGPRREPAGARQEETVKMTPLRRRVAQRLVEAQQTAALLTTFNEIDMSAVMELRKQYKEGFEKRHGIKLGFMSFFVKAVVEALKEIPQVNAEVRGQEIVYRNYQDIGIAIGGGKGLVVPILRNAERLSFAEVESAIADFARRAQANELKLEELQGGTFTISNGGIYGSLLSTPIVNPPQSGILGMHKIEERPVAVAGEVVIRPMMYVALTYDHRLVDGREAVTFLVRIKERIEDPARILLEV